jgi:hypothetical protein
MTAMVHDGGAGGGAHRLAWEANRALALLGVYATAAAYGLWALDLLLAPRDRIERLVALAGLVAAALPAALLASGAIGMNVSGALLVYAGQWAWMALIGLLMLHDGRGRAAA